MKKLPVLFKGKISTKNKNMNGTIILFLLSGEFIKYFLISEIYITKIKILKQIKKPINLFQLIFQVIIMWVHITNKIRITVNVWSNMTVISKIFNTTTYIFVAYVS